MLHRYHLMNCVWMEVALRLKHHAEDFRLHIASLHSTMQHAANTPVCSQNTDCKVVMNKYTF